jgi:ribosome recycling factor
MSLDDFLLEAEDKMSKTEHVVVNEFAGVRTGKASPALVENIMVEVYGSNMRVRELAGITTPEPRTLTIQPWDVNSLHPIEKAIQKSNLGLTPSIQGKAIRLFFPELSEERRQEFVKIIRKMAEDGRVAIRHVRRDAMEQVKKHGHDSGTTEDEVKHAEKELQKLTDEYIAKLDVHLASKEKEIMRPKTPGEGGLTQRSDGPPTLWSSPLSRFGPLGENFNAGGLPPRLSRRLSAAFCSPRCQNGPL